MNHHDDSRPQPEPETADPGLLPVPEPLVAAEPAPFAPVQPLRTESADRLPQGAESRFAAVEPSWRRILAAQTPLAEGAPWSRAEAPRRPAAEEPVSTTLDPGGGAAEPAGTGHVPAHDTTIGTLGD